MNINLKTISPKIPFLKKYQREILIGFCVFLAIFVRLIFPVNLAGEWLWLNFILFFVFPYLIIHFILQEKVADFGLQKGNFRFGIGLSLVTILVFSIVNFFLIFKTRLGNDFRIYSSVVNNFWIFLWFETIIAGVVFFAREFFFRGFFFFGLEKILGWWIVPLQAFLYGIIFTKYSWLSAGTVFLSSLVMGSLVKITRSIYYSFLAMWLISLISDIMLIKLILIKTL